MPSSIVTDDQHFCAAQEDVYVIAAVRTPIASFRSSFSPLSAVDLGAIVVKEAIRRAGISPNDVEETIVGCVLPAGQGQNIARQISIRSGIPVTSQAVTINKVCSSSLKAAIIATQQIKLGDRHVVIAAGAESMSNAPFYLPRGELPYGGIKLMDGLERDGLTDSIVNKSMGLCAEHTVKEYGITRQELDSYAIESYRRAADAWKLGLFAEEVVAIPITQRKGDNIVVNEDEEYKRLKVDKVPLLAPAFLKDGSGTITAANASSINDGAAALVFVSGERVNKGNVIGKPIAKVLIYAEVGLDPIDFTRAPVIAAQKLLSMAHITKDRVAVWEVNEAFSVTAVVFIKELGLDPSRVNVKGGAVALGHPIGASGARILTTLIYALKEDELGVAVICNGGGEATAILLSRM
ncbi:hypothetical protein AB6A40_002153 [Gnathostoma spinigerum]|uniref:Acetyl-CoA acetyltransferase n=1 Tax=Gnathostoma spinigerum TaxID=75299 RepID=A0ABD6EBC6_9BILA